MAAGVGTEVDGFLAWMPPQLAVGSNVTVLWYQREVGDHWTTWGWENVSLGEAAAWVGHHLDTSPVFSEDPLLGVLAFDFEDGGVPPTPPTEMAAGLFVGDPAEALVANSDDPAETMEILVLNGWAAAPELSPMVVDSGAPCASQGQDAVEAMLNQFTSTFEQTFFGETGVTITCQWPCDGCTRVYGAWTPGTGAWTLVRRFPSAPGTDTCEWSRPGTRTWTETGETWFWCNTCDGTGTDGPNETSRTTTLRTDPCVPPP